MRIIQSFSAARRKHSVRHELILTRFAYRYPDAEIATQSTTAYVTAADRLCTKVVGDVTGQKFAKSELDKLTTAQQQKLNTLHICMPQVDQWSDITMIAVAR